MNRLVGNRRAIRTMVFSLLCGALLAGAAPAQDGSFVSGGLTMHYRTQGSGAPVVFLSGGPGFEVDYMLPVAELFPNHRRILLEQRGTGRSRPEKVVSDDLTLRTVVQDLESLREHLKQERLFLVGHSWGGMLAMAYAAAHPDRIDRVILIDSGGPTLEFTAWFGDNIHSRLRPEDEEAQRYWREAAKQGIAADKVAIESVRAIVPGYFFDRAKALAFAAQLKEGSYHSDVNAGLMADLARSYDLRPGLRAVDRPVLIIEGHQDPVGDKTAEDIHSVLKSSTLVYLDKCGHFPWLEQPDAFRRAIVGFMEGSTTPSTR
jgi:proline iminopeptidase